ncbi:MAG: lipoate--protein ligase family protein, partial [Candidatus Wallbacteria bacterium]|nr:lipoate--protein ligase family protein [Candidatus Wallbacteria bacterium]
IEALEALDVVAVLQRGDACEPAPVRPVAGDPAPPLRACFEEHRSETVQVSGKKLVGSAQARKDGGLLQHGSIPLKNDYEMLARLFCPAENARQAFAESYRRRVTSFSEAAPGVHPSRLAAALTAAFSRALGPADAGELTDAERDEANRQLHPDVSWWRV